MNEERDIAAERLSVTLLFAGALHAIVLLGIGFAPEILRQADLLPNLDVTLVTARSRETPDKADFLAQASQLGGGTSDKRLRPQALVSGPVPKLEDGLAPQEVAPSAPPPSPSTPTPVVTTRAADTRVSRAEPSPADPMQDLPTSTQLIERALEMARLQAEIGQTTQAYAKRPRRKFISANTREYEFAAYMQAWVGKVERIGNLNYPDEARRRSLFGSLVLSVAIRRDGTVESVDVIQTSGYRLLDEAAMRIVDLAAPYQPMPDQIADKVDILHITRTWQFLPGNVIRHR